MTKYNNNTTHRFHTYIYFANSFLIVCRENLIHSDYIDCKIVTIEGGKKGFLVGCLDYCHCFEVQ
jgi:hypothetical protein